MLEYCDRYLLFDNTTEHELKVFKETFLKLVKISLWNTHGSQFLSKNPPHTGRVKTLLEMFPNAKFIYLKRNPYTVFESTRSFLQIRYNRFVCKISLMNRLKAILLKYIAACSTSLKSRKGLSLKGTW